MTSKTRRASRSTSGPTPSPGSHAMRAFMYGNLILIFNSFFKVCDFEEFDIRPFELLSSERVSKLAKSCFESVAARMLAEHNHAPRHTDMVGRHDFISDGVLEHAVLMYSRLVSECILTDDGLIHLYLFTGKLAKQLAGAVQLLCLHAGRDVVIALSRIERHDDLFQRRVSGTLADPVDRAFDLAGAILNFGKIVGNRQSQIVVAVRADRDTIGILQALPQRTNELSVFRRRLITDGIRHVDNRRARINHRIEDRTQVIDFRAAGILGRKFDLVAHLARALDSLDGNIESFTTTLVQLVLQVNIACRQKCMNARMRGALQRLPAAIDIRGRSEERRVGKEWRAGCGRGHVREKRV